MCRWCLLLSTTTLGDGGGGCSGERGCWYGGGELPFFPDFVDGMRRILVQDITGMFPGRRAVAIRASLLVAGLFIDSQSLIGDGASSDLAMVEARCLF
jgi:hypothetical protein